MLSDRRLVLSCQSVCPVCDVGVLWPNGWRALSPAFPLSRGNAETLDRWDGKTMQRLIFFYFLSKTSAENYRNRIVHVKIIRSQRWDVFWDAVYFSEIRKRKRCFWNTWQKKTRRKFAGSNYTDKNMHRLLWSRYTSTLSTFRRCLIINNSLQNHEI